MKKTTPLDPEVLSKRMMAGVTALLFAAFIFVFLWGFGKLNITGIDSLTEMGQIQKFFCCGGIAVLMGIAVFVVCKEAFLQDKAAPQKERPAWFFPAVAGVLSLTVMTIAYTFLGMWPLGEKTGMVVDMHHQYAPLLAGLRDSLLSFDLSTYSFEVGLGANYISVFGYYLASPLNILLIFFPEYLLAEGILFVTLLKNALCGAFFALCVQTVFRKRDMSVLIVSVMYSMMMYLLAYSWNIMWLDVVMVLPLVVMGFERLMHTGKYLTYVLSLAYCLYANYYIGFMLCIFMVLYYAAYVLRTRRNSHQLTVSFVRFSGFSVLGGALSAFMLIPVYLALQGTSAAGGDLPDIGSTVDIFDLLGRHLAGSSPTIRSGNLPNLYCGVLTALCVPLFALNKGLSLRRRVTYIGAWVALALSMLINWTDLAWHGFHSPNDLPYRFSFVYSFLLLFMAYQVIINLKHLERKQLLAVLAGALGYLMLEQRFGREEYDFKIIYVNILLVVIYTAILVVATNRKLREKVAYAALLMVVIAEMAIGGGNAFKAINSKEFYTSHTAYVDNATTQALQDGVDKTQQIGDAAANGNFYRMEFLPRRTCVDTALFGYRGITSFSSSNYYTTTKLMGGLGYAINGVNSHLYKSYVPFVDSLLSIRYVMLQNDMAHPYLTKVDSVSYEGETYYIYENPYALGVGYVGSSSLKNYSYTQYNPILSQNDLFTDLTGITQSLYELNSIETSSGNASFSGSSGFYVNAAGTATFTTTIQTEGMVYLYADCRAAKSMTVKTVVDGAEQSSWSVTPHEPFVIDGGKMTVGTQVTLTLDSNTACSGNFYVATLNDDLFVQGMAMLAENQLTVSQFSNNHLVGSINSNRNGVVMTSIPYDAGWTVKVDGKPVETVAVSEGFLAFDITQGAHDVDISYTPPGFVAGVAISVVALLVLLLLVFLPRYHHLLVAKGIDLSRWFPGLEAPQAAPPAAPAKKKSSKK